MPPLKVTLPTALPAVRQLAGDLKRSAREVGIAGALDGVISGLDELDAYCGRKSLDVEVVLLRPLPPETADRVAAWLAEGFPAAELRALPPDVSRVDLPGGMLPLLLTVRNAAARVSVKAGTPRPPVLVVIAHPEQPVTDDDRVNLDRALEDRPHVVLAANPGDPTHKELVMRAKALAWTTDGVDLARLPEKTLQVRLGSEPWSATLDGLRAYGASMGLESLSSVINLLLDQQAKDLKVKKSVAQQKLGKLQQGKPAANASPELITEIKGRLQRQFAEFERGSGERLLDVVGVPTGTLTREVEALLASMQDLDHEERATVIATRIPPSFEEQLNGLIRERVAAHCAADLTSLNDLFRMTSLDVERLVGQAGGPPLTVNFSYMTDDRVRRILDQYAYVQAQYRGELPKESFGDYFGDVRKYSMLLVMGASMFGVSSYLRMYREIVIPLTITLVAFGTWNVYNSTKLARAEQNEKDLEQARNSLRPEIKRALTDIQKQWSATLSQYLTEQMQAALADIDANIKDHMARKGVESNPERDRLQRQVQGLDTTEKRLLATAKNREAAVAQVPQIRSDLRPLVVGAVSGAPPKPAGAAGMGGVPGKPGAGIVIPKVVPKVLEAAPPQRDMSAARAKLAALRAKRPAE